MDTRFALLLAGAWALWTGLCGPMGSCLTAPAAHARSVADSTEACTLRQGVAHRRPAESDEAFLRRVLPTSSHYFGVAKKPLVYAWRPSAYGRQLLYTAYNPEQADPCLYVYLLDPYGPNTYAVERFAVEPPEEADLGLEALFFADANHDGRKELLVLVNFHAPAPFPLEGDSVYFGHPPYYHTRLFGYLPAAEGQRPRYQEYGPGQYHLDGLKTAAQVRQALLRSAPAAKQRAR